MLRIILLAFCSVFFLWSAAQFRPDWNKDGNSYTISENGSIIQVELPSLKKTTLVDATKLLPVGNDKPLRFFDYQFSNDRHKVLLFTDPRREYHNTFSNCWLYDMKTGQLVRLAKGFTPSSLLNSRFSPDGTKIAFVYDNNIYAEDISSHKIIQLTTDGNARRLNGWFDYVYSEELFCEDGIRWSPDSKQIAFWQMDLSKMKTFYLLNNTDSNYSRPVPLIFPKPGEPIAEARIGIADVDTKKTKWMNVPGDRGAHYIPAMEWVPGGKKLILQQLNRRQNESKIILCNAVNGEANTIYQETDDAWIDVKGFWMFGNMDWDWINNGTEFIWASEKDGWRHLYRVTLEGKETLLTAGDYDVTHISGWDEKNNWLYFIASPGNATQRYLYRTGLNGKDSPERLTPADMPGTHNYTLSPGGRWAQHNFSSYSQRNVSEWISLPDHRPLNETESIAKKMQRDPAAANIKFFTVTTGNGIIMDGWMVRPPDFDSTKKYPVVFTVYAEPFATTVNDNYGAGKGGFFNGKMADSGYIYISVEGRGAPAPKGRAWRKAIYQNLGLINANDQAAAAKEILKWHFIDPDRVAVYGSSGGGSTTMQLLFRFPEIYKTGIATAGVPSHFVYNNIYQERYMGLLPGNREVYIKCSPVTYAKNLQGHLLIIHGTGDHNVHYAGEEMLLNELIRYNKQFVFMPYPNRTHGVSEGEGTGKHKTTLATDFLKQWCPPGPK
jgi:dipeptidyl-peptidase 4